MAQYVDKSALIVEIKKEIKDIYAGREYVGIPSWEEREIDGLEKAIEILNTLEVKEVDLEKEAENFVQTGEFVKNENPVLAIAKHFFELGLRTQKGE